MFVNKLSLSNFRNIQALNISFDNPINVFYGLNGQGKSNIVESIYLLANANSFRTSYFRRMINNDSINAIAKADISSNKNNNSLKIVLTKNGKTAFIDDILINKFSDYLGHLNVICFSPEDVSLFKDVPGNRRYFLDKELSSLFPIYVRQLILFKKVLDERNELLKGKIDDDLLDVIDDKLIESSYDIYKRRNWLIGKIAEFATIIYKRLTDDNQEIRIVYHTFLEELDKDSYLTKAKKIYKDNLRKDKEKNYTNIGLHKDDFKVYLNDLEIDMYASQGQQRLIALCFKLAVLEIIKKASKEEPILILDDAFSELDIIKKDKLFNYICKKQQVFITCTDYKNIVVSNNKTKISLFLVKEGKVVERSTYNG